MIRLAFIGSPDDTPQLQRLSPRLRGGRIDVRVALPPSGVVQQSDVETLLAGHAGQIDAVLARGPLASAAEAEAIATACAGAGVRFMPGHVSRFMPRVRAVKDSLDRRQLGEPGLLRIHRWEPPGEDGGDEPRRSQGLLAWLAREIDLALWLFGEAPATVHVATRPGYAQLHLGFAGGGMALIDGCRALPAGQGYFSLSLIGSTGAAYADDHHDTQLLFAGGNATALLTGQGDAELLALCQALLTALEQGREPPVTAGDAVRALRLAETTPSDPPARVEP